MKVFYSTENELNSIQLLINYTLLEMNEFINCQNQNQMNLTAGQLLEYIHLLYYFYYGIDI